ncbi:uncharacterized protein LOC108911245 [Anoplophora glabripennis]|uniref:uncharacterized protein LOC108911245 n=1 Tax=Anoplophora glabripennis TaxID=217634 RepID=UPI000873A53B|nr:uncharacterized protein LOC108911245 [Anoplophora glabripennis]XP_018571657.1 uncharacterized protein LOC108911245 [Anoplophora glabripennis]
MSNSSSESEDENYCEESCDNKQGIRKAYQLYTEEQKIVSAVWMHERPFNYQTVDDVLNNFYIRFKKVPPEHRTLVKWEKKLFSSGAFANKNKLPLKRLIHVPYVKASLKEKPGITMNERACQLGLPLKILRQILRYDIKDNDLYRQNSQDTIDNGEVQIKDDIHSN